jgi:hypothetical protein
MAPGKGGIHELGELAGRVVVPTAKGISHMLIMKQLVSSGHGRLKRPFPFYCLKSQ